METLLIVNIVALWLVVLLLLWLVLRLAKGKTEQARVGSQAEAPTLPEPLRGQRAPDFVAFTLAQELVTRASYEGTETLFLFLSTSCPHCRNVVPEVERVGEKLLARGGKAALVFGESAPLAQTYAESLGLTLPILIAPSNSTSFSRDYNRHGGVPAFVAFDREGMVIADGVVNQRAEEWRKLVQEWQLFPRLSKAAALYR